MMIPRPLHRVLDTPSANQADPSAVVAVCDRLHLLARNAEATSARRPTIEPLEDYFFSSCIHFAAAIGLELLLRRLLHTFGGLIDEARHRFGLRHVIV
jgi:hypothetical protein